MPDPCLNEEANEIIWGTLSSSCEECHPACVGLTKTTFLAWKIYVPLNCAHGRELWELRATPDGPSQGARMVLLPADRELPPGKGVSKGIPGDISLGDLQSFLTSLEQKKELALKHLWVWARKNERAIEDKYFPELGLDYLCSQIALIEHQAEKLGLALEERISLHKAAQTDRALVLEGSLKEMARPTRLPTQTPPTLVPHLLRAQRERAADYVRETNTGRGPT